MPNLLKDIRHAYLIKESRYFLLGNCPVMGVYHSMADMSSRNPGVVKWGKYTKDGVDVSPPLLYNTCLLDSLARNCRNERY